MGRIPVYTPTLPPGRQNAFASLLSKTTNSHCALGKSLPATAAMRLPTRSTVALALGSWLMGVSFLTWSKLEKPSCISWSEDMRFNSCRPVTGTVEQPDSNTPARIQAPQRTNLAHENHFVVIRVLSKMKITTVGGLSERFFVL